MMQMLEAGRLEVLVGGVKGPDEHNPRGYYEFAPALALGGADGDTGWVSPAVGKAVKVLAFHLQYLPDDTDYRVVFMRRTIAEVLASWEKMGIVRSDVKLSERERIMAFKTEYAIYEARLERRPCMRALFVQYNDVLSDPAAQAARVAGFLGLPLDVGAMAAAVDPALYRNRAAP